MTAKQELAAIKEAITQLTEQQEALARLIGGRLHRHEVETDNRFRSTQQDVKQIAGGSGRR